jgi:uncharacterized protein
MKIAVPVLCVFLLCSIPSHAQEKTSPPPAAQNQAPKTARCPATQAGGSAVQAAKEKDIRRLLNLLGTKALMEQAVAEMSKTTRPLLENSLPPGAYRDTLIDAFYAKFRTKFDAQQLLDLAVPIYDRHFTHEEIKGLIQFYETPLGQKTAGALPQITGELMERSRKMGEDVGRQSMMEVLAEHPELVKAMEEAQKHTQP